MTPNNFVSKSNKGICSSFLQKVEKSLTQCRIISNQIGLAHNKTLLVESSCATPTLLLAVSGGIDSMVMLHAVYKLTKKYKLAFFVITVNHNLRPAKETEGDALFVHRYCRDELQIPCFVQTVPPGKIVALASKRSRGIEDAARHIRYELIKKQAKECNAHFVLFAHNRNDQLETLLQHFFQGAAAGISGTACAGMQSTVVFPLDDSSTENGVVDGNQKEGQGSALLVRPFLDISRSEIEVYAQTEKVPFREDSTNLEAVYYRNRLRHKLIPLLDENFLGWDTGVLAGAEKALEESIFINKLAESVQWEKKDGVLVNECTLVKADVQVPLDKFFAEGFPVRVRSLYDGFSVAGIEGRISYKIVKAAAMGQKRVQGGGIEIVQQSNYLVIRNMHDRANGGTEMPESYAVEVLKCGTYSVPGGIIVVCEQVQKMPVCADNMIGENYIGHFFLPLCIRSKKSGDKILTASGGHKSLKKIWNEWRVQLEHRNSLPIIEQDGQPICIWGNLYGYPNWYVKQEHNTEKQSVFVYFRRNLVYE